MDHVRYGCRLVQDLDPAAHQPGLAHRTRRTLAHPVAELPQRPPDRRLDLPHLPGQRPGNVGNRQPARHLYGHLRLRRRHFPVVAPKSLDRTHHAVRGGADAGLGEVGHAAHAHEGAGSPGRDVRRDVPPAGVVQRHPPDQGLRCRGSRAETARGRLGDPVQHRLPGPDSDGAGRHHHVQHRRGCHARQRVPGRTVGISRAADLLRRTDRVRGLEFRDLEPDRPSVVAGRVPGRGRRHTLGHAALDGRPGHRHGLEACVRHPGPRTRCRGCRGRRPANPIPAGSAVRQRDFRLRSGSPGARRREFRRRERHHHRHRGAHGVRQEHADGAPAASIRPGSGCGLHRRHRPSRLHGGFGARQHRHRSAGERPVRDVGAGQHPLRRPRRGRGPGPGGHPDRLHGGLRRRVAGRSGHRTRRPGRPDFDGPAPTAVDRTCRGPEHAVADSRRAHGGA